MLALHLGGGGVFLGRCLSCLPNPHLVELLIHHRGPLPLDICHVTLL